MTPELDVIPPKLSATDATTILAAQDCTVRLSISMGTYTSLHNTFDPATNLIYVEGFNDNVHLHNIKSIKYITPNDNASSSSMPEYIDIDWTTN